MKTIIIGLLALALFSCSSTRSIKDYKLVEIKEVNQNSALYHEQYIAIQGYVLGLEHEKKRAIDDPDLLVICIGDRPQNDLELAKQIIFPSYKNKIRVGEDGFNRSVIKLCHDIAIKSIVNKREVIIYGQYIHNNKFAHFQTGVNLNMAKIQYRDKVFNSDFEDVSPIMKTTPSLFRKLYQGGKKVVKLVEKVR